MQDSEKHNSYDRSKPGAADRLQLPSTNDDDALHTIDAAYADDMLTNARPHNKTPFALLLGLAGGVVSALIPLVVTLANSGVYQAGAREGNNMSSNLAWTITGLFCLNSLIAMVIFTLTGYLVGRLVVSRLLAFCAGAIAGAIYFILPTLLQYIPGFPGRVTSATTMSTASSGLVADVIITIAIALLGALLALLGGYIATNKHPYYLAKRYQPE
ncbi:hypothetical protein ccbrp13_40790 [Ktedonobacteria bacterium brp13]|nr:hypothetical protein ccbrp13_40790 [Ktedonobacteria bacterium brp13]